MAFFMRFMGWLILWSLMYFLVLDLMGLGPGKDPILVSAVILLLSFPAWWFSWKKFKGVFDARQPETLGEDATAYAFSLRNPALMYYLMVLKLFLLAMGANGIITLEHHEGWLRTFYIWNFIILYIYALPFFIIKYLKLKKALAARLVVDGKTLSLRRGTETLTEISLDAIDTISVEQASLGMLIEAGERKLYLGGRQARGSGFYVEGIQDIYALLKASAGDKIQSVDSIKAKLKEVEFKPVV
jgi:hypothetical protein